MSSFELVVTDIRVQHTMGHAVLTAQLGAHWRPTAGAGRSARGGAESLRGCAQPRREQAQDVPAARGARAARVHVHHAAEIRGLLPAGER